MFIVSLYFDYDLNRGVMWRPAGCGSDDAVAVVVRTWWMQGDEWSEV